MYINQCEYRWTKSTTAYGCIKTKITPYTVAQREKAREKERERERTETDQHRDTPTTVNRERDVKRRELDG